MKLFRLLFPFLLLASTMNAQLQFEGQVGVFQTTADSGSEANNRLDQPGFFAGLMITERIECLQGTVDFKLKSTGSPELQALVHLNLFWLLEPVHKLFENNDNQISLLVGGGYLFSPEYYNNLELPIDMRLNFQTKKMRCQMGVQVPVLESTYYEDNFEVFVLFTYDIPRGWNRKR